MSKPNINVIVGGPNEDYPRVYKTKYIKPLIPLSGQMTDTNTKYVIRYNHNLEDEEVVMPEGCLIEFDGGSITNGTLVGDNTILIYSQDIDTIMPDVTLEGTFKYNSGGSGGGSGDHPYNPADFSGKGQVTLPKNVVVIDGVEKNVLTQDMFMKDDPDNPGQRIENTNTIFIVKEDYVIGGDITEKGVVFEKSNMSNKDAAKTNEWYAYERLYNTYQTRRTEREQIKEEYGVNSQKYKDAVTLVTRAADAMTNARKAFYRIGKQKYFIAANVNIDSLHALHRTGRIIRLAESTDAVSAFSILFGGSNGTTVRVGGITGLPMPLPENEDIQNIVEDDTDNVPNTATQYYRYDSYVYLGSGCILRFQGGSIKDGTINVRNGYVEEDGHLILDNVVPYAMRNYSIKASSFGMTMANKWTDSNGVYRTDNGKRYNLIAPYVREVVLDQQGACYNSDSYLGYLIEQPLIIRYEGGRLIGQGVQADWCTGLTPVADFYKTYPNRGLIETANYWEGLDDRPLLNPVIDTDIMQTKGIYSNAFFIDNLLIRGRGRTDYCVCVWCCGEDSLLYRGMFSGGRVAGVFYGGMMAVGRIRLTMSQCNNTLINGYLSNGVFYSDEAHTKAITGKADLTYYYYDQTENTEGKYYQYVNNTYTESDYHPGYAYYFNNHPREDFMPGTSTNYAGRSVGGSCSLIECSGDSNNWMYLANAHYTIDVIAPKAERVKKFITSVYNDSTIRPQAIHVSGGRIQFLSGGILLYAYDAAHCSVVVENTFVPTMYYIAYYTSSQKAIATIASSEINSTITFWTNNQVSLGDMVLYKQSGNNYIYNFDSRKQNGPYTSRPKNVINAGITYKPAVGYSYFDTELGIPVWWNGEEWVNYQGGKADGDMPDEALWVDLGLPSGNKWARRNIDLTNTAEGTYKGFTASEYQTLCSFFSWGNISEGNNGEGEKPHDNESGKIVFSHRFSRSTFNTSKGGNLTTAILRANDCSTQNVNGVWRMPTTADFNELLNTSNCVLVDANGNTLGKDDSKVITIEGVQGIRFKSVRNGETLFFPWCGFADESTANLALDTSRLEYICSDYNGLRDGDIKFGNGLQVKSSSSETVSVYIYCPKHQGRPVRPIVR